MTNFGPGGISLFQVTESVNLKEGVLLILHTDIQSYEFLTQVLSKTIIKTLTEEINIFSNKAI